MGQILNHLDYRMRQILRYLKFSDTFISLLPSRKIIIKKELKPFIPLTRLPLASRLKFKRLKNSLKIIHFPPWKSKFCEKWTDIPLASFKTTGKKNWYGEFYFCSNHSPKKNHALLSSIVFLYALKAKREMICKFLRAVSMVSVRYLFVVTCVVS